MNEITVALKRKLGPLPAWAWLAVLAAGLFAVRRLNLFGGASSPSTTQPSADVGPLPSFGPYGYNGAPSLDSGGGDVGDPFTPSLQTPVDSALTGGPGTPVVFDPLTGTAQDTAAASAPAASTAGASTALAGAAAAPAALAPADVLKPRPPAPAPAPGRSTPVPALVYATVAPSALAQTPLRPRTPGDPSDAAIDYAHGAPAGKEEIPPPPAATRPATTHGQTSKKPAPAKPPARSPAELAAVKKAEARAIANAGARTVVPNVRRPGIQL